MTSGTDWDWDTERAVEEAAAVIRDEQAAEQAAIRKVAFGYETADVPYEGFEAELDEAATRALLDLGYPPFDKRSSIILAGTGYEDDPFFTETYFPEAGSSEQFIKHQQEEVVRVRLQYVAVVKAKVRTARGWWNEAYGKNKGFDVSYWAKGYALDAMTADIFRKRKWKLTWQLVEDERKRKAAAKPKAKPKPQVIDPAIREATRVRNKIKKAAKELNELKNYQEPHLVIVREYLGKVTKAVDKIVALLAEKQEGIR